MWNQQLQNDDIEQTSGNIVIHEMNGKQKPDAAQIHGHGNNRHLH